MPFKQDNSYFKDLLNKKWTKETAKNGKAQYWSGKTMMLTEDMALIEDAKFKEHPGKNKWLKSLNDFNFNQWFVWELETMGGVLFFLGPTCKIPLNP